DPVVLGLAAMDGLHIEGVAEDEREAFPRTQVGDPIPSKDTFDRHHEVLPVRGDHVQQVFRRGRAIAMNEDLTVRVQDADVHPSGMQIDPTVASVLLGIEPHPAPPFHPRRGCCAWSPSPYPHEWQGGAWMRIITLDRTAGTHSLTAAGQRGRYAH